MQAGAPRGRAAAAGAPPTAPQYQPPAAAVELELGWGAGSQHPPETAHNNLSRIRAQGAEALLERAAEKAGEALAAKRAAQAAPVRPPGRLCSRRPPVHPHGLPVSQLPAWRAARCIWPPLPAGCCRRMRALPVPALPRCLPRCAAAAAAADLACACVRLQCGAATSPASGRALTAVAPLRMLLAHHLMAGAGAGPAQRAGARQAGGCRSGAARGPAGGRGAQVGHSCPAAGQLLQPALPQSNAGCWRVPDPCCSRASASLRPTATPPARPGEQEGGARGAAGGERGAVGRARGPGAG